MGKQIQIVFEIWYDSISFQFHMYKVTSLKKKQYPIVNGKLAGRYCKFNCSSKNSIPRPL